MDDIPNKTKNVSVIYLYCDNQIFIGTIQNVMYNDKSRHIRQRHNIIRQLILYRVIIIDYDRSKENILDPLTKWLNRNQVGETSKRVGLKPMENKVKAKKIQPC